MEQRIDFPLAAEYPELVEVWEASVRETHHFLRDEDIEFFKPLILHEFLKVVNLSCTRSPEGRITGFVGVKDGKIEMLFVHPLQRGQGIGKLLLRFACEKMGGVELDVNEQNEQAVGFYLHSGFVITARSEVDGMGKPYPLLHMRLDS